MMRAIDLSPLYRSAIGFDQLATLLNNATRTEQKQPAYPPYNIELLEENHYRISMAVAGFDQSQLSVEVEKDTLIESPADIVHCWYNESKEILRVLVIKAPKPIKPSKFLEERKQ